MHEKELVIAVIALASDSIFHHISCWLCPPIWGSSRVFVLLLETQGLEMRSFRTSTVYHINNDNNIKSITLKPFET